MIKFESLLSVPMSKLAEKLKGEPHLFVEFQLAVAKITQDPELERLRSIEPLQAMSFFRKEMRKIDEARFAKQKQL